MRILVINDDTLHTFEIETVCVVQDLEVPSTYVVDFFCFGDNGGCFELRGNYCKSGAERVVLEIHEKGIMDLRSKDVIYLPLEDWEDKYESADKGY